MYILHLQYITFRTDHSSGAQQRSFLGLGATILDRGFCALRGKQLTYYERVGVHTRGRECEDSPEVETGASPSNITSEITHIQILPKQDLRQSLCRGSQRESRHQAWGLWEQVRVPEAWC